MELGKAFLSGTPRFVPSKSYLHRAIICAALFGGGRVKRCLLSDDVNATVRAVTAIGAKVDIINKEYPLCELEISKTEFADRAYIDTGASGATLRLMLAVCAALGVNADFRLDASLSTRPHGELINVLRTNGCNVELSSNIIKLRGKLSGSEYEIDARLSSQYASALAFALALTGGSLKINNLCSRGYFDLTINLLRHSGVAISEIDYKYVSSKFTNAEKNLIFDTENCFSSNAYWLAAAAINGDIVVEELNLTGSQPDSAVLNALKCAGALMYFEKNSVRAVKSNLNSFEFDVGECPDLAPVLAVVAAYADGKSRITNSNRLIYKESNRLISISNLLDCMNVRHSMSANSIVIDGRKNISFVKSVDCYNDHRIVMAAAIASLGSGTNAVILQPEAVNKSYPYFFSEYNRLMTK